MCFGRAGRSKTSCSLLALQSVPKKSDMKRRVAVVDITFEDPGALSKPWNLHTTWTLAPREELIEYVCTENNRYTEPASGK